MTLLAAYDRARVALAEATKVDQVMAVRDELEHVKLYARQIQDRALLADATVFQMRAERRLGVLLAAAKEAGQIAEGRIAKGSKVDPNPDRVTLTEIGVDRRLSSKAQKAAALDDDAFEQLAVSARDKIKSGGAILVDPINAAAKDAEVASRRAAHAARTENGGCVADLGALALTGKRFGSIGADPQWKFLTRSAAGEGRSANIHYKTEEVDKIKDLPVNQLLADDGAFYMWMVDWCPQDALDLLSHWGLRHVTTAFTWVKTNGDSPDLKVWDKSTWHMGQGYWTRCLTGSTNVHIFDITDQTVKKVPLSNLRFRPMWSYLIWSHTGWRRVRDFVVCGETAVSKISTRIGQATSSANHRWAVKRLRTFTRKHVRRHVVEYQQLSDIDRLRMGSVASSGQASVNFVFSNTPIEHPSPTRRQGQFDLSEDLGWLIGLFCAEGYFGRGSHRSQVRFALHKKETAIADRISAIIDRLQLDGDRFYKSKIRAYRHFTKVSNGLAVYFTSAAVKALIEVFVEGEGAHGKRLALGRLLQTPVGFRRALLHGMLEGDGTKGDYGYAGYRNLRLCNPGLINDFSELARGLGVMTSALGVKVTKSKICRDTLSYGVRFASPRNKSLELDGCAVTPIEIEDIKPSGSELTFDLCVDGEAFVADWMISHNSNPEQCWLATKGNPKRLYADVRQLIVAPVMEHSRKPDEWLDRIERLTEGDYLELQARRPRKGWTSWGDELEWTGVAA